MKSSLILAGLAGTLVFAAAADAQHRGSGGRGEHGGRGDHGPRQVMMLLRASDANGDNNITRAEVQALQDEMFNWMDRDGDGVLTSADRSPMHQRLAAIHEAEGEDGQNRQRRGRQGRRQENRDANNDGQISRDEFMGGEERIFERLDANDDSIISPDELDDAVEAASNRRENRRFWWRD